MAVRPRLFRSIPFWILIAGSLASVAYGAWLVVDKITLMNSTLLDGTATGVEVYGGQAWVTLGAVLVGAGLVGLVAALFLGALRSFAPTAPVEIVEPADWDAEELPTVTPAERAGATDAPFVSEPEDGSIEAPATPAEASLPTR